MARTYVFDTSAWFALLEDEDGADVVEGLLREADEGGARILTSFHVLHGNCVHHDTRKGHGRSR